MNILVDTREKRYDHVTNYFDSVGISWQRQKLDVGDYFNLDNPMVVIDRKFGLQEVAKNVCQEHARFVRELERAKASGVKLIVLVEERGIHCLEDTRMWFNFRLIKNPRAISGKGLYKIMKTMSDKYEFEWQFTTHGQCGKRIAELLEVRECAIPIQA